MNWTDFTRMYMYCTCTYLCTGAVQQCVEQRDIPELQGRPMHYTVAHHRVQQQLCRGCMDTAQYTCIPCDYY